MDRRIVLLVLALFSLANGQVMVDNFDPRVPRPGATLPASLDPYGWSRPLPPSIDPLGISYRPAHAGAVLPALYDPIGASRPGGLPFALDPVGYTRTGPGGYNGYGGFGGYGGSYGAAYDNFLARPSGFITGVGTSPIFPDPNVGAPLLAARVPGTPLPTPTIAMPVMPVSTVPVAPVAPVAPVTYPVNPIPVNPVPVNPVSSVPVNVPNFNSGAVAPAFPSTNLQFGNGGGIGSNLPLGGSSFPGVSGLPNLQNLPSLPMNNGNLQLGSRPLSSGNTATGSTTSSSLSNGNFLPSV